MCESETKVLRTNFESRLNESQRMKVKLKSEAIKIW
jgi:hypothetical protein